MARYLNDRDKQSHQHPEREEVAQACHPWKLFHTTPHQSRHHAHERYRDPQAVFIGPFSENQDPPAGIHCQQRHRNECRQPQ
jgi:hypothetical protein